MEIALAVIPLAAAHLFLRIRTPLAAGKTLHPNYRGRPVSRWGGIILYLSCLPAGFILAGERRLDMLVLLYLAGGLALLGLLDDWLGDDRSRGYTGHIRLFLREGVVSTGLIKAVFGTLLALTAAAYAAEGLAALVVGGGVIALAANTLNSLDLRPGRAVKVFLALSLAAAALSRSPGALLLLLPFLAALLAYLPHELGEKVMLGDSGANLLGGVFGFVFVLHSGLALQLALLALLAGFQVFCEFYSFSRLVRRNSFLRWLDNLGRFFEEGEENEG